jgi:outer membrane protein assembly factor BamB
MGFLKKYFYIIFFVFITACSSSLIKVKVKLPTTFHPIFGTTSHRSFYYPVNLSDSLKFLWRASSYGGFNNSSVVVYDSLVFIGELSGRVYSFNLNTGKQVGVIKTKGAVYSSPLLTNFRVYFPLVKREKNLTEFIVYDFYSGKEVHIIEIEDRIINQLLYDDNSIYLIAEDGTIYKYTLEMKLVWKTETKHNIRCVPALLDNKIIVGNQFGEIIKLDKISGNILLRKKISSNISSGITYEKEAVYFGDNDGFLFSVDPENLNVNFKVKTSSRIVMNPATDLENVYIGNLKGDFYSISKNLGEIIWAKNFKGSFNTTPIISSNKIILPDAFKAIWFLEKNTGIVIRKLELEGRAKLSPVLIDKKLFIGYDDGILEAYEFQ